MNAETEMAGADGLGAAPPNYAERLRRLRELIDDENPIDGIHNADVAELHSAACEPPEHVEARCPRYLACTSEGAGESSYRDNPDYYAAETLKEIGEWAAGSFNEGWALNWIADLDGEQYIAWDVQVVPRAEERRD